ncbi:MAG TPA: OmpH family outer membrane protein [bacterium]|nr:OmpH family outer membrane protein [bacterium]
MRTLAIALGGVLGFAAAAAAAEGTGRVGWVDTERVFKEYYRTEEMLGESSPLVREKERTEAKIEEVRAGIEAMERDLEQKALLLNETALAKKKEAIFREQLTLRQLVREAEVQLQGRIMEVTQELSEEIQAKIAVFAREQGYSYILRGEVLFYKDPALEITDQVLEVINRPAPPPAQ